MKWIKFSDKWPPLKRPQPFTLDYDGPTEVLVRSPQLQGVRTARECIQSVIPMFLLCDCSHPEQNCWFNTDVAEWLDD